MTYKIIIENKELENRGGYDDVMTFDFWTKEDVQELMEDLDIQNLEPEDIIDVIDQAYDSMLDNIISEVKKLENQKGGK